MLILGSPLLPVRNQRPQVTKHPTKGMNGATPECHQMAIMEWETRDARSEFASGQLVESDVVSRDLSASGEECYGLSQPATTG